MVEIKAAAAVVEKRPPASSPQVAVDVESSNSPSEVLSPYSEVVGVMALRASIELSRFFSSMVFVSFSNFNICSGFSLLLIL